MTEVTAEQITFRGTDRWGIAHTGSIERDPAAFVEDRYEARWQSLDVRSAADPDHQLGGIQREDDGRLTWWAESHGYQEERT